MKRTQLLTGTAAAAFTGTVAVATFALLLMAQSANAQSGSNLPANVPFEVKSGSAASSYAPSYGTPPQSGDFVPAGMPQIQSSGDATFITGGIGDEERAAMESVKPQYNLTAMSAATDGAFAGEAQISIRNRAGEEVINAMSGPLFYANLPAGTYTLTAVNPNRGDQVRKQTFTVGKGKRANVHLSWK